MTNTCPNRGCDAMYNIGPQHVGRQFACRKCGTMLFVNTAGLSFADPNALSLPDSAPSALAAPVIQQPSSPTPAIPRGAPPQPSGQPGAMANAAATALPVAGKFARGISSTILSDLFSWLFAAGTLLVVIFLFMPMLDYSKLAKQAAYMSSKDFRDTTWDKAVTPAEKESRRAEHEYWTGKERPRIVSEIEDLRLAAKQSLYSYTVGMMIGFLILAVASMGFMSPRQIPIRRVLGCIVLSAQLLLIFLTYVLRSSALNAMGGQ